MRLMKWSLVGLGLLLLAPVLAEEIKSGLEVGSKRIAAYSPQHVGGPFKGTRTCPVCEAGLRPIVQIFVNGDDAQSVAALAEKLEKLVANSPKELRAYIVDVSGKASKADLEKLVATKNLTKVGVAYAEGAEREQIVKNWQLNPKAKNTVLFSNKRTVEFNAVNLSAKDFDKLATAVKKSLS